MTARPQIAVAAISDRRKINARQHRAVELIPIIKIVEVHRVFRGGSVVGDAACTQNAHPRLAIVIIAAHCGVMLLDRLPSQGFGVFHYPRFELRIRRLVLLDVTSYRRFFESQRGKSHCIEAPTNPRITQRKLTGLLQRDFLPKPREMDNAKWTGNAGTDQWNICIAHNDAFDVYVSFTPACAAVNACIARRS